MNEVNTIEYYDKASREYSRSRYSDKTVSYIQFLFKRRRELFLEMVQTVTRSFTTINALDIGCADGVISRTLLDVFPNSFSAIVGVDISQNMIDRAKELTNNNKIEYFLRGEEPESEYNFIFEMGVHINDLPKEIQYVKSHLAEGGYFVYAVAIKDSMHARIKLRGADYLDDYLPMSKLEAILSKNFTIISARSYGLFVPKLWWSPFIGRLLQPIFENVFSLFPSLFHERIYLLKKK